jgi:hypothetical protein
VTRLQILLTAAAVTLAPLAAAIPSASAQVIYVHREPPPLRREVIIERPGPSRDWVWQAGHWRWDGHDYDWVPGHWERRPHVRAVWVPGHWARHHGDWFWVEGHWR